MQLLSFIGIKDFEILLYTDIQVFFSNLYICPSKTSQSSVNEMYLYVH